MSAVAASGDVRFAQVGVIERDFAVVAVEFSSAVVDRVGSVVEEGVGDVESAVADADEDIAAMWCEGSEREGGLVGCGKCVIENDNDDGFMSLKELTIMHEFPSHHQMNSHITKPLISITINTHHNPLHSPFPTH